jgi:hypothetical protein
MARLYVLSGADIGRTLELESSASIGRIAGCDLVLRDASISRRHARVERGPGGWEVIDEDSRNGITVAGVRTPRAPLADGDEFKLGEVLLRFRESVAPAAAAPSPAAEPSASRAPAAPPVREPAAPPARAPAPAPRAPAPTPAPAAESGLELEEGEEIELGAAPARTTAPAAGEGLREQRARVLQYHRAAESDSPLSFEFAQLPLWQRALVLTLAAALMAALAWGAFVGSAFLRGKLAQPEVEESE